MFFSGFFGYIYHIQQIVYRLILPRFILFYKHTLIIRKSYLEKELNTLTNKLLLKESWNFDNSYIHLPEKLFTKQDPTPVKEPKLIALNNPLAKELGLNVKELESNEGIEVFAGNRIPTGADPIAQAYAGHQFGYFTMLGDGRAVLLGEHISPSKNRYDIQLKGSGKTAYSRGGDGRAALGPMLREYIISEAMYGLGIPTARILAVVTTGEPVYRKTVLPGAILTRVAASHIRVGTFQYINHYGRTEELKLLSDYTILRHFPDYIADDNRYSHLLKEVIKGQAELIAKWQLAGFIHGVMNTDNMVISGQTIDYGPCAFMDTYDPNTVFSSIDVNSRYAYKNQPYIAAWNLARLAETLVPLLHDDQDKAVQIANEGISDFGKIYHKKYLNGMRAKLGLFDEEPEDESLITELLNIMVKYKADYTNTFRFLTLNNLNSMDIFGTEEFKLWNDNWNDRKNKQNKSSEEIFQLMKNSNPAIIPRNHRVEEALDAAVSKDDYCLMDKLLKALSNPYEYSSEQEEYTTLAPPMSTPYRTFCGT